jgi:hypothetical protein
MTDELPRTVDLNWIARTLLNMQADMRALRDDNLITAALLNRLDSTVNGLIGEMRALRSQFDRMRLEHERLRSRVDALEEPGPDRARP